MSRPFLQNIWKSHQFCGVERKTECVERKITAMGIQKPVTGGKIFDFITGSIRIELGEEIPLGRNIPQLSENRNQYDIVMLYSIVSRVNECHRMILINHSLGVEKYMRR